MDKRETVIESIQKLLVLGVSDAEISENLYDVGIEKPEALALIAEAKTKNSAPAESSPVPVNQQGTIQIQDVNSTGQKISSQQSPQGKSSEEYFEETVSELSMNDQIIRQIPLNKSESDANLVKQKQVASTPPSEDIADRIMADVSKQDNEGDIEDQVEETLAGVGKNPEETTPAQNQQAQAQPAKAPVQQKTVAPIQQTPFVQEKNSSGNSGVKQSAQKVFSQIQSSSTSPQNQTPSASQIRPFPRQQSFDPTKNYSTIPSTFASAQSFSEGTKNYSNSTPDFEELWKKGIVVAVNSKLAEMKHLKDDVDVLVAQKVDEAVRKELYQYKVLLDSQKDLMISSNNEALGQKQKEIVFIIDSKIAELKQYNKQLSETLVAIESAKRQQELALSQIAMALDDAKKTKSQMIVEMNSEMIKSKSQAQAFIDQSSAHLAQMDERINKTLELEKNIAEGMLTQAEQKIETLTIQRADELIEKIEVELNNLQSASKKISPELLEQKIAVLDEFKKQFLTSMQQSLAQINTAVEELNQKNVLADRTLQEKTLAIDAKLEELTKFEKDFSEGLDKLLK